MTFDEQITFIKSNNFEVLKKFAIDNNFIKYINPYAINSLNLEKIQNFLISCIEEKFKKTRLQSKPYKLVLDPTNGCNLGCPLCPTGLAMSSRKKGVLKEGIHYFTGDHYLQRYMYDPAKTKQAILNGGYDLAVAAGQKKRWAKIRGDK